MAGQLVRAALGRQAASPLHRLLAAITGAGLLLITLDGLRIVTTAALVSVPTALFLAVYLGAMVAAARVMRGPVRLAALAAALAVVIVLGFCGWAVAVPAAVALVTSWRSLPRAYPHGRRSSPSARNLRRPESRGLTSVPQADAAARHLSSSCRS
jgi:hypothetical protein